MPATNHSCDLFEFVLYAVHVSTNQRRKSCIMNFFHGHFNVAVPGSVHSSTNHAPHQLGYNIFYHLRSVNIL